MKSKLNLLLLTILLSLSSFAQTTSPWANTSERELSQLTNIKDKTFPASSIYYRLNLETMTNVLFTAPDIQTKESNTTIEIPNANGELETFIVWESSNFAPELQAAFPNIRAYTGTGITDPSAYIRISLAPNGIQTMVLRAGKKAEFIEQFTTDGLVYAVFTSRERNANEAFSCLTKEERNLATNAIAGRTVYSNTQSIKKFRLALSCTGEYTKYFGGTVQGALAGMNATLTRVNGIYEKDLAVKLELIANNTSIIYTSSTTDPYSPASTGSGSTSNWNQELQTNLTKTIGNDTYDIGHLFGGSGGGGNAGCIGCVCINPNTSNPLGKGSAYTSPGNDKPEGDTFDIDFVSHEMGHQLGAAHTFSYDNESTGVQVEPGSGSTIMAYAGVTNYDVQNHSDPYFTYRSIQQIQNNLTSKTCQTNTPLTNTPPVINAGANYTIPINTPFLLTGTGTDADGDSILYTWEQNDNSTTPGSGCLASAAKTTGPNFRSLCPGLTPTRYMPALHTILSSTTTSPTATPYEALSSVARTLNFVLTGRDNKAGGGQTNSGSMKVTVDSTKGPFYFTSFNSGTINWTPGSTQTITWNVANTNSLPGASNVAILLSTDNGETYPTVLLESTPNNGTATITVPDVTAPNCRLMIKATENIFFAINRKTFPIGYSVTTTCVSPKKSTVINILSGSSTYSSSTLEVTNSGTVSSLNVALNITHPNTGELSFILVSPSGTEIKLISNACYGGNASSSTIRFIDTGKVLDCTIPSTNDVLPTDPLYSLNGESATGTWTLKFRDDTTTNSGSINSWTLNLCTQTATALGNEEFELKGLSLYPNPVNETLNVSIEDNNLPEDFIIYNSLGQTIQNGKVNSISDLSIDTSRLSSGLYFIKMNKDNLSKTLRFIKS